MKKSYILIIAALAMATASCVKEIVDAEPEEINEATASEKTYEKRVFEATLSSDSGCDTKTTIASDGKVSWNKGDAIRYYCTTADELDVVLVPEAGETAHLELNIPTDAKNLYAVYGAPISSRNWQGPTMKGVVKAEQSGKIEDCHAAIAHADLTKGENKLSFVNITSIIKFSLSNKNVSYVVFSSNDGTAIHGNGIVSYHFNYLLSNPDGGSVLGEVKGSSIKVLTDTGSGSTFYISMLPTTLAKGFTISCYDSDDRLVGIAKTDKSVTLDENTILNLGALNLKSPYIDYDLSGNGTANCYIVPPAQSSYKFNARVKGSTKKPIDGTGKSAKVLWESFGTETATPASSIISRVSYDNGVITFTATGKRGNAVIGLLDANGVIIWSWHIWVTEQPFDQVYNRNAGIVMDRNLGATSNTPGDVRALGLLYQWGRKDPFLAGKTTTSDEIALSSITWPNAVDSDSSTGTIEYATANPTTFICGRSSTYDWLYMTDNTRWKPSDSPKTEYDPCPAGYRVPDGGYKGLFNAAFGTDSWTVASDWNSAIGMDFGSTKVTLGAGVIWYPAAGVRNRSTGKYYNQLGHNWASNYSGGNESFELYFNSDGQVSSKNSAASNAYAQAVRCCKIKDYVVSGNLPSGVDFNLKLKKAVLLEGATNTSYPLNDIKKIVFAADTQGSGMEIGDGVFMTYSSGVVTVTTTAQYFKANADCSNMFDGLNNLEEITGFEDWITSDVTDMTSMFYQCKSLTAIDLSSFDTSKLTRMASMFDQCSKLETVDISSFNTKKVSNVISMFNLCYNLTHLHLGNNFILSEDCLCDDMFVASGAVIYCTTKSMDSLLAILVAGSDYTKGALRFVIKLAGTWWAAQNIGAEKPENEGKYYMWNKKNDTGHEVGAQFDGGGFVASNYVAGGSTLKDWEDVPSFSHSRFFRMPTKADVETLFKYCKKEETTRNGVSGWLISENNSDPNSIFIPKTRYYIGTESSPGWGRYWLANCTDSWDSGYYWHVVTKDGYGFSFTTPSYYGLPIRPVLR